MPTKADFDAAAIKFDLAAEMLGDTITSIKPFDVSQILQGGSLSRLAPERIAEARHAAWACQLLLEQVSKKCQRRSTRIGEYLAELEIYELLLAGFSQEWSLWVSAYWVWYDSGGLMPDPGPEPLPPVAPVVLPSWADVPLPTEVS